jgi:hypothetical protein
MDLYWAAADRALQFYANDFEVSPLPGFILLKGENQNNAAEQAGEADELVVIDGQGAVHKEDLAEDQQERGTNDHVAADRGFGSAFKETENGDKGKEEADEGCHRILFFHRMGLLNINIRP